MSMPLNLWLNEFRSRSGAAPKASARAAVRLLSQHGVVYTIVDEPLLPLETHVTAEFAYIRWHGRGSPTWYSYDYNPEELRGWVPKVEEVAEKTRRVYGYFNNHFRWQVARGEDRWGYPGAAKNLVEFLEMLAMAMDKQRAILKRINQWRESKTKSWHG